MDAPRNDIEGVVRRLAGGRREPPRAVARAPGRVNLIGDHVDYCGGLVMPVAIPHSCYAAVFPGACDPGTFRIASTSRAGAVSVSTRSRIEPAERGPSGGWGAYALGAVAEIQDLADIGRLSGCDIVVHSDVPLGAGLSSSAALEVSVALAAAGALGVAVGGLDLAHRCQRAEHRFAGMPCGLMDQAASVLARQGHALLLDCADESYRHVPVPPSASVLIIHSGVEHELARGEYAQRRAMCVSAGQHLGERHLAHARPDAAAALPERLRPIARHVISETGRVRRTCEALECGDLARAGELMLESHASLRDDFRVSCPEIDTLVERLRAVEGVHGVRMTGGGFGGSVVALTERGSGADLRAAAERCRDVCPRLVVLDGTPSEGAGLVALPA